VDDEAAIALVVLIILLAIVVTVATGNNGTSCGHMVVAITAVLLVAVGRLAVARGSKNKCGSSNSVSCGCGSCVKVAVLAAVVVLVATTKQLQQYLWFSGGCNNHMICYFSNSCRINSH
jgi:hypothetical protein